LPTAIGGDAKVREQLLKLKCVLAHPDNESLGMGGTLAKYAAEGIANANTRSANDMDYGAFLME
jgi:hypothetical protein